MNEELINIWVKRILDAFSFNRQLLAWNSYEYHLTDSDGFEGDEGDECRSVIIPGGCTKYIKVPDVCCNKPFKATMTHLYDQWLSEGVH